MSGLLFSERAADDTVGGAASEPANANTNTNTNIYINTNSNIIIIIIIVIIVIIIIIIMPRLQKVASPSKSGGRERCGRPQERTEPTNLRVLGF